jgi:hypothetical protein
MFRLAYFGYGFKRGWALGSWIWLLAVSQIEAEAPATADDDASTIAYDNASDGTGYATTICTSESDSDVEV